jgi:DNA-binding response OmpR family regulator
MTENKKKILLVEDDQTLSESYAQRFNAEGFEVKKVSNGEEALSATLEFKPDAILLDIMMPKVDGLDVLDILRNTPETANIEIIVLSALSQQEDKDKARALGVDDYLVKSQVVLADVVEKVKQNLNIN